VRLDGAVVPDNTLIRAIVEGYVYETRTVSTPPPGGYGPSTYAIIITKPLGISYDSKPVTFLIGNHTAIEVSSWVDGGNKVVNLNATSTP
jgi:hypothetical protein